MFIETATITLKKNVIDVNYEIALFAYRLMFEL